MRAIDWLAFIVSMWSIHKIEISQEDELSKVQNLFCWRKLVSWWIIICWSSIVRIVFRNVNIWWSVTNVMTWNAGYKARRLYLLLQIDSRCDICDVNFMQRSIFHEAWKESSQILIAICFESVFYLEWFTIL